MSTATPQKALSGVGMKAVAGLGTLVAGVVVTVASTMVTDNLPTGGSRSGAVDPVTSESGWVSCPGEYDIKGNITAASEKIAHRPSDDYYSKTKPERCFTDMDAAEAEGFRPART